MAATLTIYFHDNTWEVYEFTEDKDYFWQIKPGGLYIRRQSTPSSRTVYPWAAIRKYHLEVERGTGQGSPALG